jgi:hypothetical protein
MGRWDDKETDGFDKFSAVPDKKRDDWQMENNTDFDWKETPYNDHPRKCTCPKHEYFLEQRKSRRTLPILYKYCPSHFKIWNDTKDEAMKRAKWWQRFLGRIIFKLGWVKIVCLTEMQSDLCLWCKYGSGGRGGGIKHDPLSPDMP